jgi:hypothetical protein
MAIWQKILLEQHNQTSLMFIKGKKRITNGDFIGALDGTHNKYALNH